MVPASSGGIAAIRFYNACQTRNAYRKQIFVFLPGHREVFLLFRFDRLGGADFFSRVYTVHRQIDGPATIEMTLYRGSAKRFKIRRTTQFSEHYL